MISLMQLYVTTFNAYYEIISIVLQLFARFLKMFYTSFRTGCFYLDQEN